MRRIPATNASSFVLRASLGVVCTAALLAPPVASASTHEDNAQFSVIGGLLRFSIPPSLPSLGPVTLTGRAQVANTMMPPFTIADATGTGAGWTLAIEGESGAGRSPVFAQYCPHTNCGSDSEGYVQGGHRLPAGSLTLNSSAGAFEGQLGTTGTAPDLRCSGGCDMDNASAVEIASAGEETGMGTWRATGFGPTSLALATPSGLQALPAEELYRVNELWSLTSGP